VSELPILSTLVSLVRGKAVTVSTAFNTGHSTWICGAVTKVCSGPAAVRSAIFPVAP